MIVDGSWRRSAATQAVCAALTDAGFEAYFVGGCVRNALIGMPVSDIDIATNALPEQTLECARAAGLRAIPTGADHGTITLVCDGVGHEVTTYRADVETDGRRAVVAFSEDMSEDAARRDFTMNALYARPDGTVVDPLGGLPDLEARHVRFIGDAHARIKEDHLRSLRFFRFTAWYGDPAKGIDAEGLAAVAAHLDGLSILSRERVGAELRKLLTAPDPAPAVAAMRQSGVLPALMHDADDRGLAILVHVEQQIGLAPDAMRRFAVLSKPNDTLRLSKAEMRRWDILRRGVEASSSAAELGYAFGADEAVNILALRSALLEMPVQPDQVRDTARGASQVFPIKAADLPALSGAALGAELRRLEQLWVSSDFTLSKPDLLAGNR